MPENKGREDIFSLNEQNPAPFRQPFLVIHFRSGKHWFIDVGGQIDNYLNRYTAIREAFMALSDEEKKQKGIPWSSCNVIGEASDWRSQATPLFRTMLDQLKELGWTADRVNVYNGSAGPSHVLLHGAIFERLQVKDITEAPKEPAHNPHDIDVAQYIPALLGN